MRKKERLQKIYVMLKPLHLISKFSGFLLLSVPKKVTNVKELNFSKKFSGSICNKIYMFSIIFVLIGNMFYIFYNKQHHPEYYGEIDDIHLFQLPLTVSAAILNLLISAFKLQKTVQELLHRMAVLDDLLKLPENVYKSNGRFMKILVLAIIVVHLSLSTFDLCLCISSVDILYTAVIDFSVFVLFLGAIQYVSFIFLIKQRFQLINKYITSTAITNYNSKKVTYEEVGIFNQNNVTCQALLSEDLTRKHTSMEIKNFIWNMPSQKELLSKQKNHFQILRVAYESLSNIYSMINSLFGFQILLFTVTIFTEVSSNLYYSVVSYLSWNTVSDGMAVASTILSCVWSLLYFIMLLVTAGICNLAVEEANSSCGLLQCLLLIPELSSHTSTEIKLFIQQLLNRKVKFTACSFFSINYKLLGSIVGAVSTLLVISVQFHKIF